MALVKLYPNPLLTRGLLNAASSGRVGLMTTQNFEPHPR